MARLKTLGNRVQMAPARVQSQTIEAVRISGRKLQERRLKIWAKSPSCARCGRLTVYPGGFELDHIVPLYKGGMDTEDNCQVLCSGDKGCHARKTIMDMSI